MVILKLYKGYAQMFYFVLDGLMFEIFIGINPYMLVMLSKQEAYVSFISEEST